MSVPTNHEPALPRVAQLALVWLLGQAQQRGLRSQLRKDLAALVKHRWIGGAWRQLCDDTVGLLEREGMVELSGRGGTMLALRERGRAVALGILGLSLLPPSVRWRDLKRTYLVALALELPAPAGAALRRLSDAGGLRAAVLKRRQALPVGDYPTLAEARNALGWRLLGIESDRPFTGTAVLAALLNRALAGTREYSLEEALRQLPAQLLGARRVDVEELRLAALRTWIDDAPAPTVDAPVEAAASEVPELTRFAKQVLDAARASRTGRFGDDRVFISHVWRQLSAQGGIQGVDEKEYKRRLVAAHQAGLVGLSRADLVEAMDPGDVSASETPHFGAVYHFLRL